MEGNENRQVRPQQDTDAAQRNRALVQVVLIVMLALIVVGAILRWFWLIWSCFVIFLLVEGIKMLRDHKENMDRYLYRDLLNVLLVGVVILVIFILI